MKQLLYILSLSFLFFSIALRAQVKDSILQNVIVETYYIADARDAADTTYGKLEEGAVTYRVYVDLAEGYKLRKLYGNSNHTLKIVSTDKQTGNGANFFNNNDRGKSFGKDIASTTLKKNTVALDTWLTLGQAAVGGGKNYFGILKTEDQDGSLVGGKNNADSLLNNTNIAIGVPLVNADGLIVSTTSPAGWYNTGIVDATSLIDSTIFGSAKAGSQFISTNASLGNSGVMGATTANRILVAQLTTKGEISFELNIEVTDGSGNVTNFVAKGDSLKENADTLVSPYLVYPKVIACGCMDHNYIEYNKKYTCSKPDACKTPVVLGCMDKSACNYDAKANVQVPNFCCYPGLCADRDISVVCPRLSVRELNSAIGLDIYPNPVQEQLSIKISVHGNKEVKYGIYDLFGRLVLKKNAGIISETGVRQIDVTGLTEGVYLLRLFIAGSSTTKMFIKN